MTETTSSRILRTALYTLVSAAYLSMGYWRPYDSYAKGFSGVDSFRLCSLLMAAVFFVCLFSWNSRRLGAILGFLAVFLWAAVVLLPVL